MPSTSPALENVFRVGIAWYKHARCWKNWRQLCKPSTSSRVCTTVDRILPTPRVFISGWVNTGKKVFYCFYNITSCKNYRAGKDEEFILLIKTYFPTTLIWQWHFSTDQHKTYNSKSGDFVFKTRASLRHTTMFIYSHRTTPLCQ